MATTSENSKMKSSSADDTGRGEDRNCKIKLLDLKVSDLKLELEKRDLDKNGIKSILIERLRNSLLEKGENPDEFIFDVPYDSISSKNSFKNQVPDSKTNGEAETTDGVLEVSPVEKSFERKEINSPGDKKETKDTPAVMQRTENTPTEMKEIEDTQNKANEIDTPHGTKMKCIPEKIEETPDEIKEIKGTPDELKVVKDAAHEMMEVEDAAAEMKVIENIPNEMKEVDPPPNTMKKIKCDTNEMKKVGDTPDKMKKDICDDMKEVENTLMGMKKMEDNIVKIESTISVQTSEDKINNEITLQLTIDEEEAQLNEENNMAEVSKVGSVDIDLKLVKDDPDSKDEKTPATKESKSITVELKEKKVKTSQLKSETATAVSQKVLEMFEKNDKMTNANVLPKSLWIAGLPSTTRAADLKTLFGRQGKVLSVKIVKSTKQTPGKCYGFLTMATSKDATKAIENLHGIEVNGRIISVKRTQSEPSVLLKKSESKAISSKRSSVKKEPKAIENVKSSTSEIKTSSKTHTKSAGIKSGKEPAKSKDEKSKSKENGHKSRDLKDERRAPVRRPPFHRSRPFTFNERRRFGTFRRPALESRSEVFMLEKMRQDGIRQRARIRERERKEAERRRILEVSRHRFIERKHREEAFRLEREKEKLRLEREILERERAEMLKIERERQRLERERLEREREELQRHAELRRSLKRPFARVTPRETLEVWDERKKTVPRYEERTNYPVEKLRIDVSSTSRYDYSPKDRPSYSRHEYERYTSPKPARPSPRLDYGDRDSRREVTLRTREERQVYERNDFGDRDARRRFTSRERPTSRRESSRVDWKQERRGHGRVASPSSSSAQRRMTYY